MANITWTEEAERWLREIYEYIALDDPSAAINVVEGIYDRVQVLSEFPQIGHRYEVHTDRNGTHSGTKGGRTGCGYNTRDDPSHWAATTQRVICDKNGARTSRLDRR